MRELARQTAHRGKVAYVVKGWPRLSELFIAGEIYRLERLGMDLRLIVLKPAGEERTHDLVRRIRAEPDYLPALTSLSATPAFRWLARHFPDFAPALERMFRERRRGLVRAAAAAGWQSVRARKGLLAPPRRVYLKEFLQAVSVADRALGAGDVVHLHAHFCHGSTTVAWLASLISGIPFSFTAHAKDIYLESLNPAGLLRRKLEAARFAVTCTQANAEHLRSVAPGARVYRIYHGLNPEFEDLLRTAGRRRAHTNARAAWVIDSAARSTAQTDLPPVRILGVGRRVAKKGFETLVEACGELARRNVDFVVRLIGEEGDASAKIRRAIVAHGLAGRVRIEGAMTQRELLDAYTTATVFCLPCEVAADGDRDGIPNVLLEAMASALPVVTTGTSGIPELVRDGENGLLVPPRNALALADAIVRIHSDDILRKRITHHARQTLARDFDGRRETERLAELFRPSMEAEA